MKAGNLFVASLFFCSLGLSTACSVAKDAKNANNMEKEGNAIAASVNAEKKALISEGVYLDLPSTYSMTEWSEKTPEKRAELKSRLTKIISQLYRYIEIAKHKNMRLDGGTGKAESVQEAAMKYINAIDKADGKPQTYKQLEVK